MKEKKGIAERRGNGLCRLSSLIPEVSPQMTQCNSQLSFGLLHRKQIVGAFDGGDISSDGGLMLVAEADDALGLTRKLSAVLSDQRQPGKVRHSLDDLLRQRVYQIAQGYEDCNDADDLRCDAMFKTALGRLPATGDDLASQPTLSRFENSIRPRQLLAMARVLLEVFFKQYATAAPQRIILDFDATDDETHGQQQFAEFHGYYDEHCYLPLIVTAKVDEGPKELVAAMLRPGRSHASTNALSVLKRLVAAIRSRWPEVQIVLRADAGFAIPDIYDWCEGNGVEYLIGLAQNSVLLRLVEPHLAAARTELEQTGAKVRNLHEALYAADSWSHSRRVLMKAEVSEQGDNPRFVVTSLAAGDAEALYDLYAQRGEMENRIKELKNDLQMDRTSCHRFVANQFRVLLHATAFVLLSFIRKLLAGTRLANAQVGTLQRHLLKLGVLVKETVRRVLLSFASHCPVQGLWVLLLRRIRAAAV